MRSQETVYQECAPFDLQARGMQINSDLTRAGLTQNVIEWEERCQVLTPLPDFWKSVYFYFFFNFGNIPFSRTMTM